MTRTRFPIIAIAAILIACALLTPSFALRASPAQVIVPQGSDGSFSVRVLDASDPSQVTVQVSGDLAAYIALNENAPHPDGGVRVSGRLAMPDDATPGDHAQALIIGVAEPAGDGTVSARAELAIPIIARVPYPDRYLLAHWSIAPDPGSDASLVTIALENRGRASATPSAITLTVLDDDERSLLSIDLPTDEIAPGAFLRRETTLRPPQGTLPGVYTATLRVPYESATLEASQAFALGSPRVAIERVAYDTSERGAIVPVDVTGSIAWNRELAGTITVYLDGRAQPAASANVTFAGAAFAQRLYVDTAVTGRANASVRAIVIAGGSSAERTDSVTPRYLVFPQLEGWGVLVALLIVALAFLLATLAIFGWWRRGTPPRRRA